ncbi:GNAT family N-acetyltransferase [Variovorax paradoxus]|uniref:GNAT family N-acetyltransferase n=1 Tax=Variovorax paradoxus TaxID=34073 RepID=UPI00277E4CFE|nr:GNAT family N-acetyltransferase [Variovorax paradoxus]MDP9929500.1 hypothetical protein [Variovorax paradoxus]
MTSFSISPFSPRETAEWDAVIRNSKNGNFMHSRAYLDYHANRFAERSLIVRKGSKSIAVFPANAVGEKIVSHSGLTYAGLIYGSELRAESVLEIFGLISGHFKATGGRTVLYKAVPHVFHSYPAEEDLYALHRSGARLIRRDLSSVIQMDMRSRPGMFRRRAEVRKALANGIRIEEESSLDRFHSLLTTVLQKFNVKPVHSLDELTLLHSRFPAQIRLFCAYKDTELVAGTIVYDFGQVAHSQYIASSAKGRLLGGGDLLFDHLLGNVFHHHRYFSFGISTEREGTHLNEGLIFQKQGLGGRGIAHDFYEWDL